jgi:hypothetical protein
MIGYIIASTSLKSSNPVFFTIANAFDKKDADICVKISGPTPDTVFSCNEQHQVFRY